MGQGSRPAAHLGSQTGSDREVYAALARSRTVLFTPHVAATLREFRTDLARVHTRVSICIDQHVGTGTGPLNGSGPDHVELIVIDESERLSGTAIEQQC
ncbi:hypothetical protein GXW84_31395 [Rhodococcus sp. IEGM 248]|nr:hypothetical protein [Rhodococcus sp. IEGM 248]